MRQPKLLAKIWAAIGLKNTIPESRESGIAQGAATYDDGFPAITMTPIAQGGKAPSGKDMNGILHELSAHIVHMNQGGHYKFDATFAERINGYSKGAVLINNDETAFFVSLVNQNKTDFNRGEDYARYWVKLADIDAIKQINPKDLTEETTNQKDHTGHTHRLPLASLIKKGIAQLYTGYDSQREDLALTPKTAYLLKALIDSNSRSLNDRIPNSKKSDSTTSNSSDTVATSKAAKTAYDKAVDANTNANGRVSKSGDTMTGDLTARNLNATSGVKSGYRVVVERNDPAYAPYINIYNKAVDLDTLSRIKDFAHLNFIVRRGENEKTKTRIGGRINPDKSSQLYLMASGADDVLKQNMVLFGQSGNVAIGKERDDGERLQVNGDISATKPINIKHKGWEKVRATHADGSYWRWETHPDGGSTDNSSRFNFVLTTARQETKYVSFPNVSGGSETVAYQSWVNNALGGKVNKAGDTMTGDLEVPYLKVQRDNTWVNIISRTNARASLDYSVYQDRIAQASVAAIDVGGHGVELQFLTTPQGDNYDTDRRHHVMTIGHNGHIWAKPYGWLHDAFAKQAKHGWYPNHYEGAQTFKIPIGQGSHCLLITTMRVGLSAWSQDFLMPEIYTGWVMPVASDVGDGKFPVGVAIVEGNKVRVWGHNTMGVHICIIGFAEY